MTTYKDIDFTKWIPHQPETWQYKYADLELDRVVVERPSIGQPITKIIPKGTTVRITMVSRFGDIGVNHDLNKTSSYTTRVLPNFLTNFRNEI